MHKINITLLGKRDIFLFIKILAFYYLKYEFTKVFLLQSQANMPL